MARRIGFGGDERSSRRDADAARWRKEDDEALGGAKPAVDQVAGAGNSTFGLAFVALFLMIWLVGWSAGIYFAASEFLSGFDRGDWVTTGFLGFWLTFALIGWVFAALILFVIVFGKPAQRLKIQDRMKRAGKRHRRDERIDR